MARLRVLLDTVIVIDYLRGYAAARQHLEGTNDAAISIITWIEIMVGVTPETGPSVRKLLDGLAVVPINLTIAEHAADLRRSRKRRLKLPDAIILATAQTESRVLVTRNTRDFKENEHGVWVPYQL